MTFSLSSTSSQFHSSNCASVAVGTGITVGATVTVTYDYRPVLAGSAFCFGDGSLATPCPCAPPNFVPNPSGAADAGCANSFSLAGAKLLGLGTLSPDTLKLECSIGPSHGGFGFLVKGNANNAAGVASGDGVRCADGTLVRFGGHNSGSFGAALGCWSYPNTSQTTSVSNATSQPLGQSARDQLVYQPGDGQPLERHARELVASAARATAPRKHDGRPFSGAAVAIHREAAGPPGVYRARARLTSTSPSIRRACRARP